MKANDWQSIEDLFHAASELPPGERAAYLAEACAGDDITRREVESLLAALEGRPDFMERPALSLGMTVMARGAAEESLAGRQVGSYRVLRPLGVGGMGSVYLAEHDTLERKVALKFLSHRLVDDVWAKRQFVKEAQAVAKLDHQNICPVYGFEEAHGRSFMVMQYVEGETLADLLRRGPLELDRVLDLATQIANALSEAHAHGIIHRDIKPQNIMVTAGGQVKVLDFGLAKLVQQGTGLRGAADSQSHMSRPGVLAGTVSYMSPEQLRTQRLDFRSDIFSFGTVLYQMVAGTNPFVRESDAETMAAILTAEPPPLGRDSGELPAGLSRLVEKCLRKERERRYQSASELLLELDSIRKGEVRAPWYAHPLARAGAAFALLLLLSAAVFLYFRAHRVRTLVVLPVANESTDAGAEYLDEAVTEGFSRKFSRLSGVQVKALVGASAAEARRADPREVGRILDADAILTSVIEPRGDSLVLRVRLTDATGGGQDWAAEYDLRPAEVQAVLAKVSDDTATRLLPSLSQSERSLLRQSPGEDSAAFKSYFRGRHYWNERGKDRGNIQKAIQFFREATDADPTYARAWAGLADCYVVLASVAYGPLPSNEALAYAKSAARKALDLDDTLCEAHTSLGVIALNGDWDWEEAERQFRQAIRTDPSYAPAYYWYSQLLALTGRPGEAVSVSKIAWELEPLSPMSDLNLGRSYYYARKYDTAAEYFKRVLKRDADSKGGLYLLGLTYQQKGMRAEAVGLFEKVYALDKLLGAAPLGYSYARVGRADEALRLLGELDGFSKQGFVPSQESALIYIGLGEADRAFALLRKAREEHTPSFPFIMVDPLFDSIRSDPRYPDLVRSANLSQ